MALALSAAPLLGVELSAEDVLLERQAPPKLVHNVAVCSRWSPRYEALHVLPWLAHHNLLCVDHFFDDYFLVEPRATLDSGSWSFRRFMQLIGLKLDSDQSQSPAEVWGALGVHLDFAALRSSSKLLVRPISPPECTML